MSTEWQSSDSDYFFVSFIGSNCQTFKLWHENGFQRRTLCTRAFPVASPPCCIWSERFEKHDLGSIVGEEEIYQGGLLVSRAKSEWLHWKIEQCPKLEIEDICWRWFANPLKTCSARDNERDRPEERSSGIFVSKKGLISINRQNDKGVSTPLGGITHDPLFHQQAESLRPGYPNLPMHKLVTIKETDKMTNKRWRWDDHVTLFFIMP